ncbi:MAG: DUF268 domain-containing protein [Verrucomicrobiales bacterium]
MSRETSITAFARQSVAALRAIVRNAGIHPQHLAAALRGWRQYAGDRAAYLAAAKTSGDALPWGPELPMLLEKSEAAGSVGPYFLQDQRVARWIFESNPARHVDVGSRIDGFVGSVSVFREIEVIDIRPRPREISNVQFHQLDLMNELPAEWVACTDSLSCLHTIEHFGLGRYGDPIDPSGHMKGLSQLKRMVKPGGTLYLSTPMGPERVEFNAHRVFAADTITSWFTGAWNIERFAIIDDDGTLREPTDWLSAESKNHFGCSLGVAIVAARRIVNVE